MARILCYAGKPIAVIDFLPNNALGNYLQEVEGELCGLISPDEGDANIVDVTDDELAALRRGETVATIVSSAFDDEDHEES